MKQDKSQQSMDFMMKLLESMEMLTHGSIVPKYLTTLELAQ